MAELLSGCIELRDGVAEFNDEGIEKITDLYFNNVKDLDSRIREIRDAARSYRTFSGARDDQDCSVTFIYRADSIDPEA